MSGPPDPRGPEELKAGERLRKQWEARGRALEAAAFWAAVAATVEDRPADPPKLRLVSQTEPEPEGMMATRRAAPDT